MPNEMVLGGTHTRWSLCFEGRRGGWLGLADQIITFPFEQTLTKSNINNAQTNSFPSHTPTVLQLALDLKRAGKQGE